MVLTVDQKIRMLIGEYTVQITALQTENEQLKARLAEFEKPKLETEFGVPVDNGTARAV